MLTPGIATGTRRAGYSRHSGVLPYVLYFAYFAYFAAVLAALAWLVPSRNYDADEFEHLQFAWLIHIGRVPYRDFFEHHLPLFHLLIAPLVGSFDVTRVATTWQLLALLRWLAIGVGLLFCGFTYLVARRLYDSRTALLALVMLVSNIFFLDKIVEIRPDQLGTLGLVVCSYALLRAFPDQGLTRFRSAWLVLAGVAAGCAILATQKTLFAMPGFAVAYVAMGWRRGQVGVGIAAGLLGVTAVAMPMLWYFYSYGAIADFFECNFAVNAAWPRGQHNGLLENGLLYWSWRTLTSDTLFWLFVVAGVFRAGFRLVFIQRTWCGWAVIAPLLSLGAGSIVTPVIDRQYFILLLPFAAILAAPEAMRSITWFIGSLRGHAHFVPLFALAAFAAYAAIHVIIEFSHTDEIEIDKAKFVYVLTKTSPDATIIRGWAPGLALRPPAWRFFFVHDGLQPLLRRQHWAGLLDGLHDGTIRPELIDFDDELHRLPPEFHNFVATYYRPTGIGTLLRRVD